MKWVCCILALTFCMFMHGQKVRTLKLKAEKSVNLPAVIPEGSGAVAYNGNIWIHNDSSDPSLYELDEAGKIISTIALPAKNTDWEDMTQDSLHIYIGDFGNNFGNRDTLRILKIDKSSLTSRDPQIESIYFTWPEIAGKKTNFDCEAMIASNDSVYLFTKEWKKNRQTRLFSLSVKPGHQKASFNSTFKTRVIVTGATFHRSTNRLVLLGHNLWLRPFLLVFDGIDGFVSGAHRKFKIRKHFRQVEAVETFDGETYYLISELFCFWGFGTTQQMTTVKMEK